MFFFNDEDRTIVFPKLVDINRQRVKKYAEDKKFLHFEVELNKLKVLFDLKPNKNLIKENAIFERHKTSFYNATTVKAALKNDILCHFEGKIRNYSDSTLGVSLCNGMVCNIIQIFYSLLNNFDFKFKIGLINFNKTVYLIEPMISNKQHGLNYKIDHIPHLVYKAPNFIQLNAKDLIKSKFNKIAFFVEVK